MPAELTYRINGRQVTKREWDAHSRKRKRVFGDSFQEMLDKQAPPAIRTNDTFMRGKKCQQALDMTDEQYATFKAKAEAAGVSTTGKHYYGSLADELGDPSAWVGSDSEAIATAKRKGMLLDLGGGRVHDFRDKYVDVTPEPYKVDDAIVERETAAAAAKIGPLSAKERAQLKAEVTKEITPTYL